ncbi:MAG: sensor domain-containing diguanylate cyclase, partial [Dehalococcoidia bacterium]|nr:sensor domain-containing diguanylate cyclase [Dehalococcoidia bacterium]
MATQNVFYRELLDNLYDGVFFVDSNQTITYWNRAAENITGYAYADVVGKTCFDNILVHVDEKGNPLCDSGCPLQDAIKDGKSRELSAFLKHRDGHMLPVLVKVSAIYDANGAIIGGIQSFNDNSSLLYVKKHAAELERLSTYDGLTGVGNRRNADITLQKKLAELKRYGATFGVLFADIDNLKLVNDTYGHEAGDEVLKLAAKTMLSNIRPFDFIFRWGGDEFMLILVNVDQRRLLATAERVRGAVQNAGLRFGSAVIRVTVSVGGTVAQPDDMDKSILARTDGFMYHCKEEGKNRCLVDDLSIPQAAQPTASAPVTDPSLHQTATGKVVAPQIVHIPA